MSVIQLNFGDSGHASGFISLNSLSELEFWFNVWASVISPKKEVLLLYDKRMGVWLLRYLDFPNTNG